MFIKNLNFIQISKLRLPPKYKELLDHNQSMTLRLESFYRQEMGIKIIEEILLNNIYKREMIMLGSEDHIPRELAYIEIFLENLPNRLAREEVIEGKKPFGKILMDYKIEAIREVKTFFKVYDERMLKHSKNLNDFCYGREYSILLLSGKKKLANVIENIF